MRMGRWALAAVAAAAVTLAGAAAFAAAANTAASGTGAGGGAVGRASAFLSDVASHLGVQPSALRSAIQQADLDRVDALQQSGKITAAQAQKLTAAIQAGHWRWMGGGAARPGMRLAALGRTLVVNAASGYLNVPAAQIRSDLRSGQSLDGIANSVSGKTPAGLQAAILTAVQAKLGQAVTAGKLTGARQQQILAKVQQRLPQLMARTWGHGGGASRAAASGTQGSTVQG